MKYPLCYHNPSNIVGQIEIDEDLFPWINLFTWYPSDVRRPAVPKTSFWTQLIQPTRIFTIYLNRYVFLLSQLDAEQRTTLVLPENEVRFHSLITGMQRLRFINGNPWDCRIDNISGIVNKRQKKYALLQEQLPDGALPSFILPPTPTSMIPPATLPTSSVPIEPPAAESEEELPPIIDKSLFDGTKTVQALKDILSGHSKDEKSGGIHVSQVDVPAPRPEGAGDE